MGSDWQPLVTYEEFKLGLAVAAIVVIWALAGAFFWLWLG